jgi:hypothetical protein
MSPEQILGIAEGQAYALEQQNALLQRFNQPVQQVPQDPVSRFDLDDEGYVQGKDVKNLLRLAMSQQPQGDPAARQLAAQALWANLQNMRADDFRRWGQEIEREVSKLPVEHWTLDNLKICVDIVKSRHIDELAAEKAQRLVDESHPTIRSGTGGSGSGPLTPQRTLASDTLPKAWVEKAKTLGIDETVVREFAQMQGITPEQYLAEVERYGKGAVIRG